MQDFPYETRKWYQSQDIKNHFVRFKYSYKPSSVDNERSFLHNTTIVIIFEHFSTCFSCSHLSGIQHKFTGFTILSFVCFSL